MYGTHYISGIRKESNINVILTKISSKKESAENNTSSVQADGNIPFNVSGSFEINNGNWTNKQLEENKFSISVEINGPTIEQSLVQGQINAILNGDQQNKAYAVADIIGGAMKSISDPSQSLITQYYYSPFSLYGLDGIFWDEKKQNELIKINEAVVKIYSAKSQLRELISPSGKAQLESELQDRDVPEKYINLITEKYTEVLPELRSLNQDAENYLKELENRYTICSNVFCSNNLTCCNNQSYIAEVNAFDVKIEREVDKIIIVANNVATELNKPECEKRLQGVIVIKNLSSNPYYIYSDDKLVETLSGNSYQTYYVDEGTYYFKAVQKSGYLLYPTENNRSASIKEICQEVTLEIGFED